MKDTGRESQSQPARVLNSLLLEKTERKKLFLPVWVLTLSPELIALPGILKL